MADQSDVENALVSFIATVLYPSGTTTASAINIGQTTLRIYRGWPISHALNSDLSNGIVNITVFPAGEPRDTTRYPTSWNVTTSTRPTLTINTRGNIITFGGTPALGQMVGIAINGQTFVYLVQSGDTTAMIAAALAAQMTSAKIFVQYSGSTVAAPGATGLMVRVEQEQSAYREIRRQRQNFRVSCWCPTPELRDQTASAIDSSLADINFLTLTDGTYARLTLAGGATIDQMENANLYRRDLLYSADYATTLTAAQPAMVFGTGTLSTPAGPLSPLLG